MNNPPYQQPPYNQQFGGRPPSSAPPGAMPGRPFQPQQGAPQQPQQQQQPGSGGGFAQPQQAPGSGTFRPFNPAQQVRAPFSGPPQQQPVTSAGMTPSPQAGGPSSAPARGPPGPPGPGGPGGYSQGSTPGLNPRPPQMMGPPPAGGSFKAPPMSAPPGPGQYGAPPQGGPPGGLPGAGGPPRGGPPGAGQPPMMRPGMVPPGAGPMSGPPGMGGMARPPTGAGGPPPGPTGMQPPPAPGSAPGMRGPPPAGYSPSPTASGPAGLNSAFSRMSVGGPPPAVGPPRGPGDMGPQGPGAMGPPPMGQMGGPHSAPHMGGHGGAPYQQPGNQLPSGNFQQSNEMMDGYGGMGQNAMMGQQSVITEEMQAAQCDPRYMRMSVGVIPHSQEHASKSNLTFGVVVRPLAPPEEGKDVPVVNFGPSGVVRCRHCRTYVNPFVHWVDNGRRWRCNLCGVSNDVASSYFCHLGPNQQRQDRDERPELNSGSVEIVASSEYMMRPPQPPCYVFVIDVSATSIATGMLQVAVDTIKEQLDNLPGSPRTRIGFVTYDNAVHFYNLKSSLKTPQMMVIADIEELFIPIPDELLVNLSDSREVIDTLLTMLPTIHQNPHTPETALGPAIRVAFKLMSSIGGKMLVFQSSLPSTGQGALRNRDNPRLLGTDKEHTLLNPVDTFYRSNAIDFCRQQVSVDTFLFSSSYTDVATIGSISKFSAGQVYYYPAFNASVDGEKFKNELAHCLTRETGWEAVVRVRCTKGMRLANFYGNSFLRGPDLLALPSVNADSTFAVEITHSDALLSTPTISIQSALLYTISGGERRIRVHTLCVPVSKLFAELFRSVDMDAMCNFMAKSALENALKGGLEGARTKLQNQCVEIVRAYRSSGAYGARASSGYQISLPDNLQLLPLYTMALLKNPAFRGGVDLGADERSFLQLKLNNMPVNMSRVFIYPRMFALHNMPPEAGLPSETPESPVGSNSGNDPNAPPVAGANRIVLPPIVNLSIERLASDGAFLLEDSNAMYFWIGRSVSSSFLTSLFGLSSLEGVDCRALQLLEPQDDVARRVTSIIDAIREERLPFMKLHIMREGDVGEGKFFWKLVEDRASFSGGSYSYAEYLGYISRLSLGSGGSGGSR